MSSVPSSMPVPEWIREAVEAALRPLVSQPDLIDRAARAVSLEIFRRFPLDAVVTSSGWALIRCGVALSDTMGAAVGQAMATAIFEGLPRDS